MGSPMTDTPDPQPPPVIGHTTWCHVIPTALGKKTSIQATTIDYIDQVARAGGISVLLPDANPHVLAVLDGLVICGGGDIDPSEYGEQNEGLSEGISRDADQRDLDLARRARDMGMPTLGVCRGLQAINVASGGSLTQHVLGTGEHPELSESVELNNEHRQLVTTVPGTALADLYGETTPVNSLHHQGINRLGDGLRVSATTADGMVEAIESTDGWPVIAVQWHPEILGEHGAPLFRDLVAKAARFRSERRITLDQARSPTVSSSPSS